MKQSLLFAIVILFTISISSIPCWADTNGYFYVVGYSMSKKKVYHSDVVIDKVIDISYSSDEYVTDVELLLKINTAFTNQLRSKIKADPGKLTILVRGPFKTKSIANLRLLEERKRFARSGYDSIVVIDFIYPDK